jgi:hypothetical protein
MPSDASKPRGKAVKLACFADANLMHDNITLVAAPEVLNIVEPCASSY